MSKLHKILLGVFCGGILLCGIGTGIAFTEFSSLAYGGEYILGGTELTTTELDVEFEPEEEPCRIETYFGNFISNGVETDESVPENTVRFRITYNEARVQPRANWEQDDMIYLYYQWKGSDDMALFMEAKDLALKDLKEGKIPSFDTLNVEEITVLVNPVNEKDVVFY